MQHSVAARLRRSGRRREGRAYTRPSIRRSGHQPIRSVTSYSLAPAQTENIFAPAPTRFQGQLRRVAPEIDSTRDGAAMGCWHGLLSGSLFALHPAAGSSSEPPQHNGEQGVVSCKVAAPARGPRTAACRPVVFCASKSVLRRSIRLGNAGNCITAIDRGCDTSNKKRE